MTRDRSIRFLGLAVAIAAAAAAVVVDGELELSLFMGVAVIGCLAAIDAALDRRAHASLPWSLVFAGILGGAVPRVVARLAADTGLGAERAATVSSVLFGGCIAAAAITVARPLRGAVNRDAVTGVLLLAPAVGGFAAAANHTGAGRLDSVAAARLSASLGWAAASAIVVALVLGVALNRMATRAFVSFGLAALVAAVLVVRRSAGNDDDLGWLAVGFALLAAGPAIGPPARLGVEGELRRPDAPGMVAIVLAIVATPFVILGLVGGWEPGAAALGGLAVAALILGVTMVRWSRLEGGDRGPARPAASDATTGPQPTPATVPTSEFREDRFEPRPEVSKVVPPAADPAPSGEASGAGADVEPDQADQPEEAEESDDLEKGADEYADTDPETGLRSEAGLQERLVRAFGRTREAGEVSIVLVALRNLDHIEATHGPDVASGAVAELARRFAAPFEGRPHVVVARFAPDGFAALFDGAALGSASLIERCTEVLLDLLDPVRIDEADVEIDLAAGMAQCGAREDLADFVGRANEGLELAVEASEPTLVAMP